MRIPALPSLVLVAACGEVLPAALDAAAPDARPEPVDAAPDATPEPERCNGLDDDLDGAVDETWAHHYLRPTFADGIADWSRRVEPVAAGQPSVIDGALYVDDAGEVLTKDPAHEGVSWVYDLDLDRGTQVARPVDIGNGAFDLIVDVELRSSAEQSTLAGLALTDGTGKAALFLGGYDGSQRDDAVAEIHAWVRAPGADPRRAIARGAVISTTLRATRTGRTVTFEQPGTTWPPWEQLVEDDLRGLALMTIKDRFPNAPTPVPYGNFTVRSLALCWGTVAP